MKKLNPVALFALIREDLSEADKIGCGWILFKVNNGVDVQYSQCTKEGQVAIDLLIQDQLLMVDNDKVVWNLLFEEFLQDRENDSC